MIFPDEYTLKKWQENKDIKECCNYCGFLSSVQFIASIYNKPVEITLGDGTEKIVFPPVRSMNGYNEVKKLWKEICEKTARASKEDSDCKEFFEWGVESLLKLGVIIPFFGVVLSSEEVKNICEGL